MIGRVAPREALSVLKSLGENGGPSAFLFRSLAHIELWEFDAALPWVEGYLARRGPAAHEVLKKLIAQASRQKNVALELKLLNLSITNSKNRKDFSGAEDFLFRAKILGQNRRAKMPNCEQIQIENLLIEKNETLLQLKRKQSDIAKASNLRRLEDLRHRGEAAKLWHFVRDCDYQLALATGSHALFCHVIFGTPHKLCRERMEEEFRETWGDAAAKIPTFYMWRIGGMRSAHWIDVRTGEHDKQKNSLKAGQELKRALEVLSQDLYRPLNQAALHAELFPIRPFNRSTSPKVLKQIVVRLRSWLKAEKIPLGIEFHAGFYKLVGNPACELRVWPSSNDLILINPRARFFIRELQGSFQDRPFSRREAADRLRVSFRSMNRYLREALNRNCLEQIGRGPSTVFRLTAASKSG